MPRDDLAARLLLALDLRDERALASLLTPDVAMVADTGDQTGGELRGRVRVIRALLGLRMPHPDASLEIVHVNGGPGLAMRRPDGCVVGVLVIDADRGREPDGGHAIDRLWLTTAPGRLAHWNRRRPVVE
ncbi:hypothetical protein [Agromyces sp. H66]|uniref:hypothetical protein n=1 Tax=Agromyces sp. H66 TaxID=2529859 RepID=UPI0010AA5F5A|nr:hypothetical protein [Agromyces sp. H66]